MRILFTAIFFLAIALSTELFAAEQEFTLLLLEDNLIGEIETLELGVNSEIFIDSYYALLPPGILERARSYRQKLHDLLPRYTVAYSAADSAEVSELMDKISFHWGALKSIHAKHFSSDIETLLNRAYDDGLMRNSR